MKRMICILILALSFNFGVSKTVLAVNVSTATVDKDTPEKLYDQMKLLVEIVGRVKEKYVDEVETEKIIYGAASGLLKPLDPFSQFMPPKGYTEMKVETTGEYGGLGIRISVQDNWLTVVSPLPNTPAYRLGILPGDKIIEIEGESTQGLGIDDAVEKLRGVPGTKVTITVAREGVKEPIKYTITREVIKLVTVQSKLLEKDIGYLQLYEFSDHCAEDMYNALKELEKKGMKSLVLDLRNNPGGLLDRAIDVSRLFLGNSKLIVYTAGRVPESKRQYHADKNAIFGKLPVVVLINRGSASASEIVAGAFQDHKRALVVGSESFGKGSVQSVYDLSGGCGLRLTTAKYYTPSGRCIERNTKTKKGGIEPDVKIEVSMETMQKLHMQEQEDEVESMRAKKTEEKDKKERVQDEVLNRAIELLKAREVLIQLQEG